MEERLLESFLEMMLAERSVASNTVMAYQNDLKGLLEYAAQRSIQVQNISLEFLEEYLALLRNKMQLSSRTISRKISAIRQFYQFLLSEGVVEANVATDLVMPSRPQTLPKALEQSEIAALFEAAYSVEAVDGVRMVAMLEILYATGVRISELVMLKMQSLERGAHKDGVIRYILLKGKGGKERVVLLHDDASEALQRYLEIRESFIKNGHERTSWLFPSATKTGLISHLTRQRFGQMLKETAILAGLDHTKISPHKIRHSFATHMLKNGANLRVVQELLGHANIASTQIYTKVTDEQAKQLVLDKHPLRDKKS